jgi:hypothetical protein
MPNPAERNDESRDESEASEGMRVVTEYLRRRAERAKAIVDPLAPSAHTAEQALRDALPWRGGQFSR